MRRGTMNRGSYESLENGDENREIITPRPAVDIKQLRNSLHRPSNDSKEL